MLFFSPQPLSGTKTESAFDEHVSEGLGTQPHAGWLLIGSPSVHPLHCSTKTLQEPLDHPILLTPSLLWEEFMSQP